MKGQKERLNMPTKANKRLVDFRHGDTYDKYYNEHLNPKTAKKLRSFYDKAVNGKIHVLDSKQIRQMAKKHRKAVENPDEWTRMDKLIDKTRHTPFMYRTKKYWDKPSLEEDPKNGVRANDHYFLGLARSGRVAHHARQRLANYKGRERENRKPIKHIQKQLNNKLKSIDYELKYHSIKNQRKSFKKFAHKKGISLKDAYSDKFKARNIKPEMNYEDKFMNKMEHHSHALKRSQGTKYYKPTRRKFFSDFKTPLFKHIGKHIKNGVQTIYNKASGLVKHSKGIMKSQINKLKKDIKKHPTLNEDAHAAFHTVRSIDNHVGKAVMHSKPYKRFTQNQKATKQNPRYQSFKKGVKKGLKAPKMILKKLGLKTPGNNQHKKVVHVENESHIAPKTKMHTLTRKAPQRTQHRQLHRQGPTI